MRLRLPAWLARIPRPGATARIALGLLSLTASLVLALDLVLGIFPSEHARLKAIRERSAVDLAIQVKVLLARPQTEGVVAEMLSDIEHASQDIESIGVRRTDGVLVAATPRHAELWKRAANEASTLSEVSVPLNGANGRWGSVEIRYADRAGLAGWRDWFNAPLLILLAGLGTAGLLMHYLYLRRMLQHLDPSQAIPERVRTAFNTLTEGLLVLDMEHRILLANDAFARLQPGGGKLVGRPIGELAWLAGALERAGEQPPWVTAVKENRTVIGVSVELSEGMEQPVHALLNCAAIRDASGHARGCLLTLDDVTELDRVNGKLRQALNELEASRDQIQRQNEDLQLLANYDPLTGCMNRRAFFARAEKLMAHALATGEPIACLMTDIDKFKNFNDTYGHTVGDHVIQQVAKLLHSAMRTEDLLCRYGGEEFCILLPGVGLAEGMRVAQRIRAKIESEAGPGVRSVDGLRITSSFGVSTLAESKAHSLDHLIERADEGLYAAKDAGRNRVRFAQPGGDALDEAGASAAAKTELADA